MINLEKYADKLMESNQSLNCSISALRTGTDACPPGCDCHECKVKNVNWIMQEYKEPEIDWTKVKRGMPVFVRDKEDDEWFEQRFFAYDTDFEYPFIVFENYGLASLSAWKYCKLKAYKCCKLKED